MSMGGRVPPRFPYNLSTASNPLTLNPAQMLIQTLAYCVYRSAVGPGSKRQAEYQFDGYR